MGLEQRCVPDVGCQGEENWNIGAPRLALVRQRKLFKFDFFFFARHVIPLFGAVVLKLVRTKALLLCSKRL